MKKIKIKPLLLWVLGTLAVGTLAGLISMGAMDHYKSVAKPPLSPPAILFPVAWSILYVLMGVSAYLVWTNEEVNAPIKRNATGLYVAQLAVNFFWPIIFFNAGAYFGALIWIVLLDVLVIAMMIRFSRISRAAAWLNLPYLLWLLFATYLNFGVWQLNK